MGMYDQQTMCILNGLFTIIICRINDGGEFSSCIYYEGPKPW